jgi:hypothetical protein
LIRFPAQFSDSTILKETIRTNTSSKGTMPAIIIRITAGELASDPQNGFRS